MQGGFLTEEDLEKYLVYGESSFTGPAVSSSSYGYTWQQPHSIALGAEGPSGISRRLTVYPWLDQSVYGMLEACTPECMIQHSRSSPHVPLIVAGSSAPTIRIRDESFMLQHSYCLRSDVRS